jgi:hypothetical protein
MMENSNVWVMSTPETTFMERLRSIVLLITESTAPVETKAHHSAPMTSIQMVCWFLPTLTSTRDARRLRAAAVAAVAVAAAAHALVEVPIPVQQRLETWSKAHHLMTAFSFPIGKQRLSLMQSL